MIKKPSCVSCGSLKRFPHTFTSSTCNLHSETPNLEPYAPQPLTRAPLGVQKFSLIPRGI